jgi:hypothetical protein
VEKLTVLLSFFVISSCATQHKQYNFDNLGEYYWNNPSLSSLPVVLFQKEFKTIKNTCESVMQEIHIPKPDCVLPARNTCSMLTAVGFGMCYNAPVEKCDYRAVTLAKKNQEKLYSTCMSRNGWRLEWKEGEGNDISGGIFEYVAADKNNEYFIKKNTSLSIGNKYQAVLRIISKDNDKKSFQGFYVFDVSNNTLSIDDSKPVAVAKGSAADTLLSIIKQSI